MKQTQLNAQGLGGTFGPAGALQLSQTPLGMSASQAPAVA